jgi:hypothetical protein
MRGWIQLEDGGSGRWLYIKPVPQGTLFLVIEDAIELCGKEAATYFYGSLALVDPSEVSETDQQLALSFMGCEHDDPTAEVVTIALFEYGAKAPLHNDDSGPMPKRFSQCWDGYSVPSETSRYFTSLRARLRKAARDFESNPDAALDKVVNAVGQTARQYARGVHGLWDTLLPPCACGAAASECDWRGDTMRRWTCRDCAAREE